MPRKPNYDFERRERERVKAAKLAERAAAKAAAKLEEAPQDAGEGHGDPADVPPADGPPADAQPVGALPEDAARTPTAKAERSAQKATGVEARQKSRRDDETSARTAEAEKIARLRALRLQKEDADRAAAAAKPSAQPKPRKGG